MSGPVRWTPVVLYMAFLFALSSVSRLPAVPALPLSDKIVHALLYVALGALVARALDGRRGGMVSGRTLIAAVLWSAAYGVSDEVHQHFVPGRQMDAFDVLADAIGAAVGAGVYARARARTAAARRRPGAHAPKRGNGRGEAEA